MFRPSKVDIKFPISRSSKYYAGGRFDKIFKKNSFKTFTTTIMKILKIHAEQNAT